LISLASLAIASATNLALDNSRKPIRKRRVVMLRPEDVEQGSDTAIAKISRANSDAATEDASSILAAAPSRPEILVDLSRFRKRKFK
jgi:DNA-directed RNA polymerase specialized sigma24 family protein